MRATVTKFVRAAGTAQVRHAAGRATARFAGTPRRLAAGVLALLALPFAGHAQSVPTGFVVETVASNLDSPVAFQLLSGGRVLYAEQFTGIVRLWRPNGVLQATPVLTVPGVVAGGERGLLGLALDPRGDAHPYLYVLHDAASPSRIRISRFTLSGDLDGTLGTPLEADPASRYDLIDDIPDQAGNHNGGTLQFGLDGLLYASLGEDGVPCAAQDTTTLRGVLLRLRTDRLPPGPGRAFRAQVAPSDNPFAASPDSNERLVAAFGLRNPFRFQVDPVSGALVIGDVGESLREELDLLTVTSFGLSLAGGTPAQAPGAILGANFGWPYREGTVPGVHRLDCAPEPVGLAEPIFDYDRTSQSFGAAVIPAGAYRRHTPGVRNWPVEYDGNILANDYYTGVLRRIVLGPGGTWELAAPVEGQADAQAWGTGFAEVSDWRVGPDGALWFCRQSSGFVAGTGSIGFIAGPGDPGPPPPLQPLEMIVFSTPSVGSARFVFPSGTEPGAQLTLYDLGGRALRHWDATQAGLIPSGRFLTWDGRDGDGRDVRPGLYVARLESAGRALSRRVLFLR